MASFLSRRHLLLGAASSARIHITGMEFFAVRATARTTWMIVRLRTNRGSTGLGEASDAFGFARTTNADLGRMKETLARYYALVHGQSPLDVERYRRLGYAKAGSGNLVEATAFSAIEQALWDLAGKVRGTPVWAMLGGKKPESLPVYANINRATVDRSPAGFAANASEAVADGFRAIKAAPFDGFPKPGSPRAEIGRAVERGIACAEAMRKAAGPDVKLMIDFHSFFSVPLAIEVARRLEPQNLFWCEEPVPPERTKEMGEIRAAIHQKMAAGELLFGVAGFRPLCRERAADIIMPDVKHCGGMEEVKRIAQMAGRFGVAVSPHNPSGPVSTRASVHACAAIRNFLILEHQWKEANWRAELITPPEVFSQGRIRVPDTPGFGMELNEKLAAAHKQA